MIFKYSFLALYNLGGKHPFSPVLLGSVQEPASQLFKLFSFFYNYILLSTIYLRLAAPKQYIKTKTEVFCCTLCPSGRFLAST